MSNLYVNLFVDVVNDMTGTQYHVVMLNGEYAGCIAEKYLPYCTVLPWKEFLLNTIGCSEENLSDMLDSIEEGTF
jgi:hypothetical protein